MFIRLGQRSPTGQWRQRLIDADWSEAGRRAAACGPAGRSYECSYIDDVSITHLFSFEIASGRQGMNDVIFVYLQLQGSKCKWPMVFFNSGYHQRLISRP